MKKILKFLSLQAVLMMTLTLVPSGFSWGHAYLEENCIRYMEIDAELFKRGKAGEFQGKPVAARNTLVSEYLKVYNGPTTSSELIMRTLLLKDRDACPKLPGFRRHLIEDWWPVN